MNGTYTTYVESMELGLTLEDLEKAWTHLQALLPVLLYHTSEYMPQVNADGEPFFVKLTPTKDYPQFKEYIVFHPDNLPLMGKECMGKYRLVRMMDYVKATT